METNIKAATHTPGPWKVAGSCHVHQNYIGQWYHVAHVTTADDYHPTPCIADVCNRDDYHDSERAAHRPSGEQLANARLIAAAPELLALLTEVADHVAKYGGVTRSADKLWSRVNAAIAAAEGGPQ